MDSIDAEVEQLLEQQRQRVQERTARRVQRRMDQRAAMRERMRSGILPDFLLSCPICVRAFLTLDHDSACDDHRSSGYFVPQAKDLEIEETNQNGR